MFLYLKNFLQCLRMCMYENTNLLTSDYSSLFKASASVFVKELEVWFKSIDNLA